MKIVVNPEYGRYEVPEEVQDLLYCDEWDSSKEIRTNPIFIKWVEEHPWKTDLGIAEIPDNATDYIIIVSDGIESIAAVIDGKIQFFYGYGC